MEAQAKERLHVVEQAIQDSLKDLSTLFAMFPNGVQMYNQVNPWSDFCSEALSLKINGQELALTGFYRDQLTCYNKDKSEFVFVSPHELPLDKALLASLALTGFLTPKSQQL